MAPRPLNPSAGTALPLHRNVAIHIAQSQAAVDERRRLAFARTLVVAKIMANVISGSAHG